MSPRRGALSHLIRLRRQLRRRSDVHGGRHEQLGAVSRRACIPRFRRHADGSKRGSRESRSGTRPPGCATTFATATTGTCPAIPVDDQSEQSSNSVTATVNGATRSWGYYRKSPPCGWSGQGDRHRAHGDHYTDAVDSGGNGSGHRSVPDCAAGDGYDAAQRSPPELTCRRRHHPVAAEW